MPHDYIPLAGTHFWSALVLCMEENGDCMWHVKKSGNSFCKNSFCGLQMVQFECPRVIHPLLLVTSEVHYGVPFFLDAGKGKSCMWLVNNVEIYFAKRCFLAQNGPIRIPKGHIPFGISEAIITSHKIEPYNVWLLNTHPAVATL